VAVRTAALALLVCLLSATTALAAFPQDPPNDPGYAPAEGSLADCLTKSADDQQHYLFSFMPQCNPVATDAEGAAGMSVDIAWRDFTTGDPSTVIAYVEGGINWRNGDAAELRNRVYVNGGELPAPSNPDSQPGLNADDFAIHVGTPTGDANGNGVVDPEDIIVRFSDGVDDDGNGYVDDISGWDFYNDQNDPATLDSAYDHANNQMNQAAAQTDNGVGGAGICPNCMLLPVKAGAEALDRTDDLAQAWLFAGDSGADVIVSTTADLGYSTFMSQAVDYLWNHGVVMVESSNDFDSTDHQGGMFHQHVLPGNGLVSNVHGLGVIPGVGGPLSNPLTTTYRARSGYTSWGTHNMFSVSTTGGTTSEATPTVGGVMALVLSYGKQAAAENLIDSPLTNAEAIQVVRATASDIAGNPNPPTGWEGKPGFDLQYGYGRPNVHKAMQAINGGDIPPVAWFSSPDWYALYDPTKTSTVPVTGHVDAPRSEPYTWKLEFAPGAEPTDGDFITANSGGGSAPLDGSLGSIDLSQVPQSFWDAAFELSNEKTLATSEQYTVTLRIQVTDADGRVGEERRSIAVHRDPSLMDGFPVEIGPGGEAQPVLADLQGRGELNAIFGDSDGNVHAFRPDGTELPGFPVHTDPTEVTKQHDGVDAGNEPILIGAAVGDLDGDGRLSIAATSTTGRVYVWDADGQRRPGFPKVLDTGVVKPAIPRPDSPFTRQPLQGATSCPLLADMNGDGKLDIVQVGWDGYIHVYDNAGHELPGWPVKPEKPTPGSGLTLINDQKIDVPPALAQLDDDPEPELVIRSQYNETPGPGLQVVGVSGSVTPPVSHLYAYNSDGTPVPGWPNSANALVIYYGSAQEFITEGANAPITADVNNDGKTEVEASAGIFSPSYLFAPNGSQTGIYGPVPDASLGLLSGLANGTLSATAITNILGGDLPVDAPVNFTGTGAFGKVGPTNTLSLAEPGSGVTSVATSLLLPGLGTPINNYMRVHEAASGAPLPGFPAEGQGLDFLGAPVIADVTGDGQGDVIQGGDSSALHAFTTGGAQASGFPKFMTGWIVFGPSVGDFDGDGQNDVVATTREGYLMSWNTNGDADANQEWWSSHHDERNTGQYGLDTRPPGILRDALVSAGNTQLDWTAPGDDWYTGTAERYEVVTSQSRICPENFDSSQPLSGAPAPSESGDSDSFPVPADALGHVAIRAVDEAGNLGPVHDFDLTGSGGGACPSGGGGGGGGGAGGGGATGRLSKLNIRVKPKRARAGKRSCFKVLVTGPDGSPVPGATIQIGRKQRQTNAAGRRRICRRFKKAGRPSLTATKPGYDSAARSLRVRKPR
jgi:Subtilase family